MVTNSIKILSRFIGGAVFTASLVILSASNLAHAAPGDNVALGGTALQSSTLAPRVAGNCIDGVTAGANELTCHTSTGAGTRAWWQVDLGSVLPIDEIRIFNRDDCCQDRLRGVHVMVSDTAFDTSSASVANLTAALSLADFSFQLPDAGSSEGDPIVNAGNVSGRFIRLQKSDVVGAGADGNEINLLEVQVIEGGIDASNDFVVRNFSLTTSDAFDITVLANDTTVATDDTLCIVDPSDSVCKASFSIAGQGTFSVDSSGDPDVVNFDPDDGFSGRVDTIAYRYNNSTSDVAQIFIIMNERALCEAEDPDAPPNLLDPFVVGVIENEFFVFDIGDANVSGGGFTGGGNTGPTIELFDTSDLTTYTLAPDVEVADAGALAGTPTDGINSMGLDSNRDALFFASTRQIDGDDTGVNDTLFMYDGDSGTLYELVGQSYLGDFTANEDGDNNTNTFNGVNYTNVNALAASFGIPAITTGNTLGGAAGEYFGGSYYFGTEGGGPGGDDQLWRLDLDFNNPLPGTDGRVPSITNMQLVHTFPDDGGAGGGPNHDWGDIIILPDISDGSDVLDDNFGDGSLTLIDIDRGDNLIRMYDISDPGDGTARTTEIATLLETITPPVDDSLSQAAISFDNNVYIFVEGNDGVRAFDLNNEVWLGVNGDTEISDIWPEGSEPFDGSSCVDPFSSLPVTLSHFESRSLGSRIEIKWQTATETFTSGFNLWAEVEGQWYQLNKRQINTRTVDSMIPQSYTARASIRHLPGAISRVALTSVDVNGYEEGFGPFEVGETYGSQESLEPIAWADIRASHDQRMNDDGYTQVNNRWVRNSSRAAQRQLAATEGVKGHVGVTESGMYRVSHEELVAAGIDLSGHRANNIAVSYKGQAVPRHIGRIGTRSRTFGPGYYIDFYGESPMGADTQYIAENLYQVSVDPQLVSKVRRINSAPGDSPDVYTKTAEVNEQSQYAFTLPTEDPWYQQVLSANPGAGVDYPFSIEIDADADTSEGGRLNILLGALSDAPNQDIDGEPGTDPDHEIEVTLNGQAVVLDNPTEEGYTAWQVTGEIAPGQLVAGTNNLVIRVTGDTGYAVRDLLVLDRYSVEYARPLLAQSDRIEINDTDGDAQGYAVDGFTDRRLVAYAYAKSEANPGVPANLARLKLKRQKINNEGQISYRARIPTVSDGGAGYWISTRDEMRTASTLYVAQPDSELLSQQGDYLIIVHPSFMPGAGDDENHPLNRYIAAKQSEGDSEYDEPVLINLHDIYEDYGYGMALPEAITRYLSEADEAFDYNYVLLVGGDVFDYLDYRQSGAISFIPTRYARTSRIIGQTPTDALLMDFDGDELADKPHGRFPVRTLDDLTLLVDKTLAYQAQGGLSHDRSALLIAENIDSATGINFSGQLERINQELKEDEVPWENEAGKVTKVYVDDLIASGLSSTEALVEARTDITEGFDAGHSVTVFSGHASTSRWSFSNMFRSSQVAGLADAGNKSSLVMPLACYTTYYNSTSVNTLAHQLLFAGDKGAVGIHGAIALSDFKDNESIGRGTLHEQLSNQMTLGKAVEKARSQTRNRDVRINWAVLADPTTKLH